MKFTKKDIDKLLRLYSQMVRIRKFEDNANQLYLGAKMPGLTCIQVKKQLPLAFVKL